MTAKESEGFDLDAIPKGLGDDVIYELGGGVTLASSSATDEANQGLRNEKGTLDEQIVDGPLTKSEEFKQKGNECFKAQSFLDAIDFYTDAIEHCPGLKGEEMLKLRQEHEEKEREKATQRYNRDSKRRVHNLNKKGSEGETVQANHNDDSLEPQSFVPPVHEYGEYLAVYYSNRAACHIQLGHFHDAIMDCDIAILVQPTYVKAYIRRMNAYEKTEQTELAFQDAKKALELQPTNREISSHVKRLEKLEAARMEKLKEETMGKLKELGNSILGNFGMSLDNFKSVKDPKTGSYSISFQN